MMGVKEMGQRQKAVTEHSDVHKKICLLRWNQVASVSLLK